MMTVIQLPVALLLCAVQVYSYTLTGCSTDGNFEIVENQPTSITCTGLGGGHYIYWSITWPSESVETRIGDCRVCSDSSPCPHNCSDVKADFTITRTSTESTLYFVHNLNANDGATIKCSQQNNVSKVECDVIVIKAYRLLNCENNTLEVVDNGQTEIICTGIDRSQSMYWSIIYPDGEKESIAECQHCDSSGICPDCDKPFTDYDVARSPEKSTLKLTSTDDREKNGATVKCSKKDNRAHSECQITVLNYNLPQCKHGQLDVSEAAPWTPIVCEDLRLSHNIQWQITVRSTRQVASCRNRTNDFNCTAINGFTASRSNGSVSELMIVERVREKAGNTLTCLRQDNAAAVKCELRVFYPGELHNASVIIDSNFTVLGHVVINKIFASHGNIACHWYYTQDNQRKNISYTNLSLDNFTANNDLMYQRGTCDMAIALDTVEASYKFTVDVQPGHGPVSAGTVIVRKPNGLQLHETTCPEYVAEGSDLRCVCQHPASQQGSPAASIHWENMTDTGVLEVTNVTRKQSGTQYICTSVWAEGMTGEMRSSITYTLRVAYGPYKTTVTAGDKSQTIGDQSRLTLTCTYDEAFPSVNFSWNVPCIKLISPERTNTCSLDLDMTSGVEEAVCTVFNSESTQLNASAPYRLSSHEENGKSNSLVEDVVGGTIGGIICIVLVVVVVVLVCKWRANIQSPSQTMSSVPLHAISINTSQGGIGESLPEHDNDDTHNNGPAIPPGADEHIYAKVDKTKKKQKPAGTEVNQQNIDENNDRAKQPQAKLPEDMDMEPEKASNVPPLPGKQAHTNENGKEVRDAGTEAKTEPSQVKEVSQNETLKGDYHETPEGRDDTNESANAHNNCMPESTKENRETDVNTGEAESLAQNQDNKVEQSAQINACTNVQASQPQPTKHGDSNTNAQQQDAEKSTEAEDVYQNVTPESSEAMGTNDDEYQSLQLSRQRQREDPAYSHLA